jgi:NADH-quinone oxidoreductase subunit H
MDAIINNPLFLPVILSCCIVGLFPLVAGYLVLVERKVLADMQVRLGPMRVGPHGILQPLADALKLLIKEDIIPADADKAIFWMAPVVCTVTALCAFGVIPLSNGLVVADVNVGLMVVSSFSSVGILGIILGGWGSNSHYSLLGSLRSAAQLVSYEVALGLALLSAVMVSGSLSMVQIVQHQFTSGTWGVFGNFGFMIVPFMVYFISGIAELNRAPFDLPEAESELVAGFHTEYSGFRWALYFLAEYANMVVVSAVAVTLFWGGWLRPFPNIGILEIPLNYGVPLLILGGSGAATFLLLNKQPAQWQKVLLLVVAVGLILVSLLFLVPVLNHLMVGLFWFVIKICVLVYSLIWFRGTFPRLRYDQLMNFGWRWMIPIGMGCVFVNAVLGMIHLR